MFKILKFISMVGILLLFLASIAMIGLGLYQLYIQYALLGIFAGAESSTIGKLIALPLMGYKNVIGIVLASLSVFLSFRLFFSLYEDRFPTFGLIASLLLPAVALLFTAGGGLFGAGISAGDIFPFFIGYAVITLPIWLSFIFARKFNDMKITDQGVQ